MQMLQSSCLAVRCSMRRPYPTESHVLHSITHFRTCGRPPKVGWSRTAASHDCKRRLRFSRNAGRYLANVFFGGKAGRTAFNSGTDFSSSCCKWRNALYRFRTCIVVPSLVCIAQSYTTYAPPTLSPTDDHPGTLTFRVKQPVSSSELSANWREATVDRDRVERFDEGKCGSKNSSSLGKSSQNWSSSSISILLSTCNNPWELANGYLGVLGEFGLELSSGIGDGKDIEFAPVWAIND